MAMQGHIQELSEKHKKLEELIEDEMAHPDWNEVRVAALKKAKTPNKRRIGTAARQPPLNVG